MKTNYPDSLTIQQYLEGKLDPEVMHQLEKQALDDPFLWDALEGYSTNKDAAADLSILQRQLHERIVHLQENKKVFDLSWQRLSVAAAAAVMFVSAGILFWMNSHKPGEQRASNKHVEVSVIDRDSVNAVISSKDEPVIASLKKDEPALDKSPTAGYNKETSQKREAGISPKSEDQVSLQQGAAAGAVADASAMAAPPAPATRQAKAAKTGSDNSVLNEVVIASVAQPKPGWEAYREYINLNTKAFKNEAALKGSVLLSFAIDSNGKLSNFKILRGLNEAYNQEAIRIVKEGPEWVPATNGTASEMKFEVNF